LPLTVRPAHVPAKWKPVRRQGHVPIETALTRRRLLVAGAASAVLTALGPIARPAVSRAADRPRITHGLQSGDVTADSGVVWARTDRPARMLVEAAASDSFRDIIAGTYVDALPESDFTGKVLL
jgi:alkaline phosphatase D